MLNRASNDTVTRVVWSFPYPKPEIERTVETIAAVPVIAIPGDGIP
jgi:hypothetical protein